MDIGDPPKLYAVYWVLAGKPQVHSIWTDIEAAAKECARLKERDKNTPLSWLYRSFLADEPLRL